MFNPNGTLKRDSVTANGVYRTTIYSYKADNSRIITVADPLSHVTISSYDNCGRLNTRSDYLNNTVSCKGDHAEIIIVTINFFLIRNKINHYKLKFQLYYFLI